MSNQNSNEYPYWAFISYSHKDRPWGDWLHRALETYRIPKRLVGTHSGSVVVPARFLPVFMDRAELPASTNLTSNITDALSSSRYLIVICSRRSATSHWVNQEIATFQKLGRGDRILACIVDGEPNASDGKPGFLAEDECFPLTFRRQLHTDGSLSDLRSEPIAVDLRPNGDGKRNAVLKLAAAIIGVQFDTLRQREQERRNRRFMFLSLAALVLAGVFGVLSLLFYQQRCLAINTQIETKKSFSMSNFLRANELSQSQQYPKAVAYLARSLRVDSGNKMAARKLFFMLGQFPWFLPTKRIAEADTAVMNVTYYDNGRFIYLAKRGAHIFSQSLSNNDLESVASFAAKLSRPSRAIDRYVAENLSPTTKMALLKFNNHPSDPLDLQSALLDDLNRIVHGPLIFDKERFTGIDLRYDTESFLTRTPLPDQYSLVNRMLLEDAYPTELPHNPQIGVVDNKTNKHIFKFIRIPCDDATFDDNGESFSAFVTWDGISLGIDPKTTLHYATYTGKPIKRIPYAPKPAKAASTELCTELLRTSNVQGQFVAVAYSSEQTNDGLIEVYDKVKGKLLKVIPDLSDLQYLKFSQDGVFLAACRGMRFDIETCAGTLDLFKCSTEKETPDWIRIGSLDFDNPVLRLAFSADNQYAAATCSDGTFHFIRIDGDQPIQNYIKAGGVNALKLCASYHKLHRGGIGFSLKNDELVAGGWHWARTGTVPAFTLNRITTNTTSTADAANRTGNRTVESAFEFNTRIMHDTVTGGDLGDLTPIAENITDTLRANFRGPFVWCNPGTNILVTMTDNRVQLWNGTTGKPMTDEILLPEYGGIGFPCFAPDNSMFAIASAQSTATYNSQWVQFFDTATGCALSDVIRISEETPTHLRHPQIDASGTHLSVYADAGVYRINIPGSSTDAPMWLAELAETICGFRVTERSVLEELSPEERLYSLNRISDMLKQSKGGDIWSEYGKLILGKPPIRDVSGTKTVVM